MKRKIDYGQLWMILTGILLLVAIWVMIIRGFNYVHDNFTLEVSPYANERAKIYSEYYEEQTKLSQIVRHEADRLEQECRKKLEDLDKKEKEMKDAGSKSTNTER